MANAATRTVIIDNEPLPIANTSVAAKGRVTGVSTVPAAGAVSNVGRGTAHPTVGAPPISPAQRLNPHGRAVLRSGWRRVSDVEYVSVNRGPSATVTTLLRWNGQEWVRSRNVALTPRGAETGAREKVYAGGSAVSSRAGEISRENPTLSDAESLGAALAEQAGYDPVPKGGGAEATEHAKVLAEVNRIESAGYKKAIEGGATRLGAEVAGQAGIRTELAKRAVSQAEYEAQVAKQEATAAFLYNYTTPEGKYDLARLFRDVRDTHLKEIGKKDYSSLDIIQNELVDAGFDSQAVSQARAIGLGTGAIAPTVQYGRPSWVQRQTMSLENWLEGLRTSAGKVETGSKYTNLIPSAAEGLIYTGASAVLGIPLLVLKMTSKPTSAPALVWDTGQGMVTHVGGTAVKLATNAYGSELAKGNAFALAYDTAMSYLIISGAGRGAKGVVTKVATYVGKRGVPFGLIGKEPSTGRIKTPEQFAKNYAEALNEAERLATAKGGKFTGEVPIEGTTYALRYLKTPVSQKFGDVLFHGTKDEFGKSGKLVKESALRIAERQGYLKTPERGTYTSPWAAIGYTRGGQNPGLLMILTDSSRIKSGAKGLAKGLTESDRFIRRAEKGFYGSSKTWKGDLETEVVAAPGTKFKVPPPKSDLLTRTLAGRYADFVTSDGSKFVPIKIALDKGFSPDALAALRQPSKWYGVKLYSLYGALRDASEAIRHPGLVLKDVAGTARELVNLDNFIREGTGTKGGMTMPGLRNVYLTTGIGQWLRIAARDIANKAFQRTKSQLGESAREDSAAFRRALERNMDDVYRDNARSLVNSFRAVAQAYAVSDAAKSKFEAAYLANLSLSAEALSRSAVDASETVRSVTDDVASSSPVTERGLSYLESTGTETAGVSRATRSSRIVSRIGSTPATSITSIRTPSAPTTPITPPSAVGGYERRRYERRWTLPSPPVMRVIAASSPGLIIPDGSITWKMGELSRGKGRVNQQVWKYIPPDRYNVDTPITIMGVPHGAVKTDLRTPEETVQIIGSSRTVPALVNVDVGWANITVKNGREIEFVNTLTGEGAEAAQAAQAAEAAQMARGIARPEVIEATGYPGVASSTLRPLESSALPIGRSGVTRVGLGKTKPKRKEKREDWYTEMTSVQGVRF